MCMWSLVPPAFRGGRPGAAPAGTQPGPRQPLRPVELGGCWRSQAGADGVVGCCWVLPVGWATAGCESQWHDAPTALGLHAGAGLCPPAFALASVSASVSAQDVGAASGLGCAGTACGCTFPSCQHPVVGEVGAAGPPCRREVSRDTPCQPMAADTECLTPRERDPSWHPVPVLPVPLSHGSTRGCLWVQGWGARPCPGWGWSPGAMGALWGCGCSPRVLGVECSAGGARASWCHAPRLRGLGDGTAVPPTWPGGPGM